MIMNDTGVFMVDVDDDDDDDNDDNDGDGDGDGCCWVDCWLGPGLQAGAIIAGHSATNVKREMIFVLVQISGFRVQKHQRATTKIK